MTQTAKELRQRIEQCELPHPAFQLHIDSIRQIVMDALDGFAPRIAWSVGPSRAGKTMMLEAVRREHPAVQEEVLVKDRLVLQRHVPLLYISLPSSITPKLLPAVVLMSLGVPVPSRGVSTSAMFTRMSEQLRMAGTKVIFVNEASHLVEDGSRMLPRAAADWFKDVSDLLGITVVLSGLPRLERLFQSNEQLRLRANARLELRPYRPDEPAELRAFAVCVKTYADMFADAGWPIDVALPVLTKHCYLLSGGLVGVLSVFMQNLAVSCAGQPHRTLSFDDCARTAASMEIAGNPDCPPFMAEDVAPVELQQAYAHVMNVAGLSVRANGKRSARPVGGRAALPTPGAPLLPAGRPE